MKSKSDLAVEMFNSGYNCAQAVLCAFCADLDLAKEKAMKLATGFGAGMGRKQEVCGAVTGGIMVIGLQHGQGYEEDTEAKELTYRLTRELITRFTAKHGSCLCRELLDGCDLSTEAGQKFSKENDLHNKICAECVRSAVQILEDILSER